MKNKSKRLSESTYFDPVVSDVLAMPMPDDLLGLLCEVHLCDRPWQAMLRDLSQNDLEALALRARIFRRDTRPSSA